MRRRARRGGRRAAALACGLLAAGAGGEAAGQEVSWRDLVVTGGVSTEGYQGNLPSVAAVVRDSADFAAAFVGELAVRGELEGTTGGRDRISLSFDGGLRQFSARGFELRDYAPREWAGRVGLEAAHPVGSSGRVSAKLEGRGRDVQDRPPMPLFMQPGYRAVSGAVGGRLADGPAGHWDAELRGEWTDFLAPAFAPQIRLLDRRTGGLEVGLRPEIDVPGALRVHAGIERSGYPEQSTLVEDDPYRRDRTLSAGASWTWQGDFLAQVAGEVRRNRSNSRRPEYDAGTARGLVVVSLPGGMSGTMYAALTAKRYRFHTEFARLIPGEEANSQSQAYVSVRRPVAGNLDATVRMGWARAETEIGGQYFQRYGGTLLLNYRPRL